MPSAAPTVTATAEGLQKAAAITNALRKAKRSPTQEAAMMRQLQNLAFDAAMACRPAIEAARRAAENPAPNRPNAGGEGTHLPASPLPLLDREVTRAMLDCVAAVGTLQGWICRLEMRPAPAAAKVEAVKPKPRKPAAPYTPPLFSGKPADESHYQPGQGPKPA